ncbi:LOW QUALITY PROTEIN: transmembrane and ubiquitin-like domain-containing protein 1 [Mixophyes fleayi]|uniref:LOW QUALITY PROTEIN: transmembrane and ubiquitin-like domain-containing protein 1 n=1 Tax=Mixophyes fleayi TaxID=3061075 RepID=UPI003F4E423C
MALIEGVDDEVTLLFAVLLLLIVIVLAWISTHTAERSPAHSSSHSGDVQTGSGRNVSQQEQPEILYLVPTTIQPDSDGALSNDETGSSILLTDRVTPPSPEPAHITGEPALGTDSISGYTEPISPSQNSESPSLRHRGPHTQAEGGSTDDQESITLRLKFLNDTERVVTVRMSDTVLHIKRSQFPGQESRVRLIYQGHLLRNDSQTVASLQLMDNCVLHCHISQHASAPGQSGAELDQVPLNIGSLLVPLLGLILFIMWYCQLQYPHLFTATATASLALITLLVTVIAFSSYRR